MAFFVFFMSFSFIIVNCRSSFEHGGLGAIVNVYPTPFLIPIALLLWTQKTAISASLARSDRIKPNCMTPDLASICIHCCRPGWMKANDMNWHHFGFFYYGGIFTSFVFIPSFHKNNADFRQCIYHHLSVTQLHAFRLFPTKVQLLCAVCR